MRRNPSMTLEYTDDLRLFRTRASQVGLVALAVLWLLAPLNLDDFWLSVLNYVGVTAIGAIGLNLLTGYTGQISLGHAFFLGVGAYTAAWLGNEIDGVSLLVWIPAAALVGGLVGAAIGPFALRLRGPYLAIVTLGLLFFARYLFNNWESVTGGGFGTHVPAALTLGPIDFGALDLAGETFTRDQGLFWLIWALVALGALLAKNITRTRPGRALQAVRDRDLAAEIIGVSSARYKVGAFAISSAYAAVAGALYGAGLQQFVSPSEFGGQSGLFFSILFIAIIIVGGVGTIFGSILGALVVGALPRLIEEYSESIPGLSTGPGDDGIITVFAFNQALFGILIVAFLMIEPRGLAAAWLRLKAYFRTWPFSY
jgi:branched-chain amino acid transport system permease protein